MGKVFGKESKYRDAGKRWTIDDEAALKAFFLRNLFMDEIVKLVGRGPGGILLRLKKMHLIPDEMDLLEYEKSIKEMRRADLSKSELADDVYKRRKILLWWEQANWQLRVDQKQRFLAHPTLSKLIGLNLDLIEFAISKIRLIKLDEIYGYAYGKGLENKSSGAAQKDISQIHREVRKKNDKELKVGRKSSRQFDNNYRVDRGKESLRKFGLVNPPPSKSPDLRSTSLYNCSICRKPVVGNSCACDGW